MEDSQLRKDIQLELDLLARIEKPVDQATERLEMILGRNPEKFASLIRVVDDKEHLRHLGSLMRRVRTPIMKAVLSCWFSEGGDLRARTKTLLDAWIVGQKTGGNPRRDVFAFADLIIHCDVSDRAKADLLAHFVTMKQRLGLGSPKIFADVLAGYGQLALDVLWEPFWKMEEADGQLIAHGVIGALWKIPRFTCPAMLESLVSEDPDVRKRAGTAYGRAAGRLGAEKDADVIERVLSFFERYWEASDEAAFERTVHRIFSLRGEAVAARLKELAGSSSESVRRKIVFDLVSRGEESAYPAAIEYGRSGDRALRKKALQVLANCRIEAAKDLFRERISDEDPEIRKTAVTGFALVANRFDEAELHDLMKSDDKKIARAAARAFGGRHRRRQPTGLEENRIKRMRGDAEPGMDMSPIDSLMALPEIRPYTEKELSQTIARVCTDWATTRRHIVMGFGVNDRLMTRSENVYAMTELGESVWRVGQFLKERGVERSVVGRFRRND